MKRTKKFLGTILTAIFLCVCFMFVGCSKKIEGTYKFKSMSYNEGGVSVEINVGEEFMGMVTLSEDFVKITLEESGVATVDMAMGEESETTTGSWKSVENGKVEITFDGEPQVCACDGKTLTIEIDGQKIVLQK